MKKIFLATLILSLTLSCSLVKHTEREHNHEMSSHHHHDHNHHHMVDIEEFKGEIFNYHNVKGSKKHSHVLLILSEDKEEAFIRIDGHEYELELTKSASGTLYISEDKKISFHIKGNEASLEENGEITNYFLLKSKNKNYAKSHNHDHN